MKISFKNKSMKGGLLMALLAVMSAGKLFAAPPVENTQIVFDSDFMSQFRILVILLVVIVLLLGYITVVMTVKDPSMISLKYVWDSVSGGNAADPEMDHEYDGIRELDNPIPGWLAAIFYGTVIFAVVYLFYYQFTGAGPDSREEYEIEMANAAEMYKNVELPADQLELVTDPGKLEIARNMYLENCATCHGNNLEGNAGPNLTDEYWLHGGNLDNLYEVISNGVPGKTMIGWKATIPSQQRLALASYILSLQGSNPANAKAPEGEKFVPEADNGDQGLPEGDSTVVEEMPVDSL